MHVCSAAVAKNADSQRDKVTYIEHYCCEESVLLALLHYTVERS
jgi:hypothetical protein